ncbi:MAG: hypothetical protein K9K37_08460 [Desulfocapsa sp.]|nr:hypothetical protein [Desulfocapsa sp.]
MWQIIVGIFVFGAIAQNLMKEFDLSRLAISFCFSGLGFALYFTNVILINKYIKKNAPDFLDYNESSSGNQKWESTAGLGVVPKWVSLLGLMAISAIITAILPWIFAIFK